MPSMNRLTLVNIITVMLLALVLAGIVMYPKRVNHDVGHLLLVARLIVEGNLPYAEIHDINMPITHYLHVLPTLMGRMLHINPIPILLVLVLGLIVWCIWMVRRLSQLHPDLLDPLIAAGMGLTIAVMTVGLFVLNDYAQRDHLFVVCYLPGFVIRWLRWQGRDIPHGVAITAGVIAAMGAWIKPHFLVIIVLVELYWLVKYGNWRALLATELLAFAGFTLIYGLHVFLLPEAVQTGFLDWFGFVTEVGYKSYGYHQPIDLILGSSTKLAIGLAPFFIRPFRQDATNDLLKSLGILTIAGAVEYGLQQRGYGYHQIPAIMAGSLVIATTLFDRMKEPVHPGVATSTPARWAQKLRPETPLIILLAVFFIHWTRLDKPEVDSYWSKSINPFPGLAQIIRDNSSENDPILFVTSELEQFRLLVQENRTSATGDMPSLTPVFTYFELPPPVYYEGPTPAPVQAYLEEMAWDIENLRPPLIFVGDIIGCAGCPDFLSFTDLLQRHSITQEYILPSYERLQPTEGYQVYHYVGEPDTTLGGHILFDGVVHLTAWRLHEDVNASPCQSLTVDTWWETPAQVEAFYSMTLVLTEEGSGIAHSDGTPSGTETLAWTPGQRYADQRSVQIPCDTPPGEYFLLMGLYTVNVPESTLATITYEDGTGIGQHFYLTTISVK